MKGRRILAAVLLALGLGIAGATSASAIDIPNPLGDAILDKVCPPRQAPYPASPGAQIVARGGGAGTYAQYGYAGLRWTTWDSGCLSMDKADTAIGSQINAMANSVDEVINELQAVALDPDTTASLDTVIARAVDGLREAFWTPWVMAGLAAAGILLVLYGASGRTSEAFSTLTLAVVVVGALGILMAQPNLPARIGNELTSGVAEGVAGSLVRATPGGTMPSGALPREKFTEGYYQVSRQAWLDGSFCGDADAARVYGDRLLWSQAFTVDELEAIKGRPAAAEALVEAKGKAWTEIGEAMPKTHPAAFGCWKGEGNSRMAAAVKHAVVSVSAGFWVALGSVALLAMKWVLRLAVLFAVTFGAVMLFSRRFTDRVVEFVLLGLLGPPLVAAGVGTLLWGYYAILLDTRQAWWQAGVAAFALGLALWMAKGVLGRLFVGASSVQRSGSVVRKGSHRVVQTFTHTKTSSAGATVAAAAAGGAAGAAVAASQGTDDSRRQDPMGHEDKRQDSVDTAAMQGDAPAQALARARQMAHRASQREDAPRPRRGPSADYVILDEAQQFMADDEPRDPEPHVPETFQPKRHGRPLGEGWKAQGADVERVYRGDGRRDDA